MGDLFLTRSNDHERPPVIGFFQDLKDEKDIVIGRNRSSYFLPIEEGTVGIYFRKNVMSEKSSYWIKFHEVWIEGKKCVIHENYINPLPKNKGKKNE